jgi:T-complex protein 1 subunit alpha
MEHMADTMGSREQLAVACFAQSLLVIPKTLAVNGAYDATELVAQMRSRHHAAQTSKDHPEYRWSGLNLEDGAVRDNLKAGVLEPAISKVKMIRFATEAAVTILRIDDAIKMNPAERPGGPGGNGY